MTLSRPDTFLAPVTFGERALARMSARKTKPQSWYLDVSLLRKYSLGENGVADNGPELSRNASQTSFRPMLWVTCA